jgi:hypothetical protein
VNLRKHLVTAAAAATALLAGTALPASAVDTTTTFTLTGGDLALSVQATATLTDAPATVGVSAITGSLGAATVTDARGGVAGWIVSGLSSVFTGPGPSNSTSVQYSTLVVTEAGTASVALAAADTDIGVVTPLLTATAVSGNNTADWNPALKVNMPAGARAGAYSGTVTTSIV